MATETTGVMSFTSPASQLRQTPLLTGGVWQFALTGLSALGLGDTFVIEECIEETSGDGAPARLIKHTMMGPSATELLIRPVAWILGYQLNITMIAGVATNLAPKVIGYRAIKLG